MIHIQEKCIWVPSHTEIIGNELADGAANEAITSPSSVKFQDALIKINNLSKSHWQDMWEETPSTNKLKGIKASIAL